MPTYDFCCEGGHQFEVFNCAVGQKEAPCPHCKRKTHRIWEPGAWTTPRTGIYREHYSLELGANVRSRRHELEVARKKGLVRKEDVVRKTRPHYPTVDEFMKARAELTDTEVRVQRERRERLYFEERSGLREPQPEA